MKSYVVYKHTCPNNQVYIGITSQNVEQRWKNGEGYRDSWFYISGIKKFGWKNIHHKILYENLSYEEAIIKEYELILKYESWCPGKGYNDSVGLNRRHGTHPIKIMELNTVFLSVKVASNYLNIPTWSIYNALKSGNETHGYIFEYACEDNCDFSDICIA